MRQDTHGSSRFLLTNDDGIEAPGLAVLAEVLSQFGLVTVVAPENEMSGCGHQATTRRPLTLRFIRENWWAVDGTPVDCVRVGLTQILPNCDWVMSGINPGGNLGADVYHSGTVAAVREAALLARPGVAISHYQRKRQPLDWSRASLWCQRTLSQVLERPPSYRKFWNVNFPDPDPQDVSALSTLPMVHCDLDDHPLPVTFRDGSESTSQQENRVLHYAGDYQQRPRRPGKDVALCFGGNITISEVSI